VLLLEERTEIHLFAQNTLKSCEVLNFFSAVEHARTMSK
jgi:hypothetical protein